MNILYIGKSSDWHVSLWVKYFTKSHSVWLFSDKEDYLKDQPFNNVTIIKSNGYFGRLLNSLTSENHMLYQMNKLLSVRYFAYQVDKVIKKYNIDIVHAHSLYYGYLVSFIKSDVPIVFTPMGSDIIIHAQKNFIYRHMAKKAFNRADVITGDSLLLQKQGYKVGARKDRNYVIQNGVDRSVFFPKSSNIKQKYGIADDEVLLFSPRAITPIYNIDIIIESLSMLKKKGYVLKCMFSFPFGNEYVEQLQKQISRLGVDENVIWLGYLTYEDMAEHYNAADVVISVPSSDSSPKSVYEAMFCKKPIIITDLEWSYELLSGCNCFIKVEVRNSVQLSNAIAKIIDDPDYANTIATNAMNIATKYYDYESNMKKMEEIMIQAIENV